MPYPGELLYPSPGLYPGDVGPFTEGLEASLAAWQDPQGDWYSYIAALGSMFEAVYSLVADFGDPDDPENYTPGWSTLLDPVNCPDQFLPFAAQFVGLTIQPGTDPTIGRQMLTSRQGFQRGSPGAIIAAAQSGLTGTQSVALLERTPDAYSFVLVIHPSELVSLAAIHTAVDATKPAGITWSLVQTSGWVLFQMEAAYGTITALESAFVTDSGLENDQPGS